MEPIAKNGWREYTRQSSWEPPSRAPNRLRNNKKKAKGTWLNGAGHAKIVRPRYLGSGGWMRVYRLLSLQTARIIGLVRVRRGGRQMSLQASQRD
jgi:hypothetical protein